MQMHILSSNQFVIVYSFSVWGIASASWKIPATSAIGYALLLLRLLLLYVYLLPSSCALWDDFLTGMTCEYKALDNGNA